MIRYCNYFTAWAKQLIWLLIFLCCGISASSQDLIPHGWFHQSQAKLGEPIHYSLVLNHSSKLEFYFPDSTHDFSPFEYLNRTYFPTQTDSLGNSYDSVVYTLATFELGQIQYLSVPLFLTGNKSPRPIYPPKDSIQLVELIQELPDSLSLFENTKVATIQKEFNHPLLVTVLISLALLALFCYIVLGDSIKNYFLVRKVQQRHLVFLLEFDQLIYEGGEQAIEPAIVLWKSYSGNLMNIPLNSYTTKEIGRIIPEEKVVIDSLKQADKAIYAGEKLTDTNKKLAVLKEFSQKRYEQQVELSQKQGGGTGKLPPLFKWLPAIKDKTAHIALYSISSFIVYLLVFLWNDTTGALLFPFITFLIISYLAIIAYKEKITESLSYQKALQLLYGQANATGILLSLMYGIAVLIYGDKLNLLTEFSVKTSVLVVMICLPIAKLLLASMMLPLYYMLFHKKKERETA